MSGRNEKLLDRGSLELDDRAGPASPISAARASAMVHAALEAMDLAAAPPARVPSPRRMRVGRWAALAVAAALLVAGAVAAAQYRGTRSSVIVTSADQRSATAVAEAAARAATAVSAEALEPEVPPEASATAAAATARPSAPAPSAASGRAPAVPADDLLRQANELRRQKRWAEAERVYRKVIAAAPGTPAARAATVAAASLRLEHLGDPQGALRMYESAAGADKADLGEEAAWGVVEAQRARGDRRAEMAALRAFLASHPQSLLAPAAKERLRALTSGGVAK